MWPLGESKVNAVFQISDPKKNISKPMKQNRNFEIMTSQRPFGGQYVASKRSQSKNNIIFEILDPKTHIYTAIKQKLTL